MKRWMKCFGPLMCAVMLQITSMALAQDLKGISPRAQEDVKAFMKKVQEGDALFNQKKYAEAAAALAAAHELFQRADRRDPQASGAWLDLSLKPYPAMRYYGYDSKIVGSLEADMKDMHHTTLSSLHGGALEMWEDASILSGAAQVPNVFFSEVPLVDFTEEAMDREVEKHYDTVRRFELPVPDNQWHEVVKKSRQAKLIVDYALEKYPEWKTNTRNWVGQPTGESILAVIDKTLAEAEPEYKKLTSDFKTAEPAGFAETMNRYGAALNKAIAGVKRNGWMDWGLARDIFLTKDHLSTIRKGLIASYAQEGKTMPADKMKPLENKVAELKSAIDKTAPRWSFPPNKPHNAAIENQVKSAIKGRFNGVVILKTALDGTNWTIQKNEFGLPRYRERDVLALVKIPGQKWPWLISGSYHQDYAGGGTFNSGGAFSLGSNYAYARMQTVK